MALVKVRGRAQITLPPDARNKLKISEGDLLEAEVVAGTLVLRPVAVVGREKARERLLAIINRPKRREPLGLSPEEEERRIFEEVEAFRHRHG